MMEQLCENSQRFLTFQLFSQKSNIVDVNRVPNTPLGQILAEGGENLFSITLYFSFHI